MTKVETERRQAPGRRRAPRKNPANGGTSERMILRMQGEQLKALRQRVKDLEAELDWQEVERREALEQHPVAFLQLTPTGKICGFNRAAMLLLRGRSEPGDTFVGQGLVDFVGDHQRAVVLKHLADCALIHEGRRHIETAVLLRNPAGGWLPARLVSTVCATNPRGIRLYQTAIIDMSESQASQQWLSLEDRNIQQLIESLDAIVWEAEHPLRLVYASPQMEGVLGYPPEKWLRDGRFWENHVHVEDRERVMREREMAFHRLGHHVFEYRFHSAKNGVLWLRDSVLVTRNAQGHTRLQGLIVNITPLKNAELELRRLNQQLRSQDEEHKRHLDQTVESMETFCYGIAHELRAPVRALSGFGEMVAQELGNLATESIQHHLRRISAAAARMEKLIDDLLSYGRLHHADLLVLPVRVNNMIARALQSRGPEIEQCNAIVRVTPTTERVYAHPMLLTQALENLIANALKFVEAGKIPELSINTWRMENDRVRLAVSDNGVGIDLSWQHKIFGVFQRAHSAEEFPGTGIGLAMVKRIAELLDGEAGVHSKPGEGSTFWIDLRVAPAIDL